MSIGMPPIRLPGELLLLLLLERFDERCDEER